MQPYYINFALSLYSNIKPTVLGGSAGPGKKLDNFEHPKMFFDKPKESRLSSKPPSADGY